MRFGNVLGSRGSVLTAFAAADRQRAARSRSPHPEVTRYFMTIAEAVQLVIQAGAIGRDGEALVLDMGEPVEHRRRRPPADRARRQAPVDIVYTGLRPGEKLHEELFGDGEPDERPVHPLISHTPVPHYSPLEARELDPWLVRTAVTRSLGEACLVMHGKLSVSMLSSDHGPTVRNPP